MHYQHVLGFEGFLFPGALEPPAHKLLLLSMNMVIIDMLGVRKEKQTKWKCIIHFQRQQKEVEYTLQF
jgi:hypothetical protein